MLASKAIRIAATAVFFTAAFCTVIPLTIVSVEESSAIQCIDNECENGGGSSSSGGSSSGGSTTPSTPSGGDQGGRHGAGIDVLQNALWRLIEQKKGLPVGSLSGRTYRHTSAVPPVVDFNLAVVTPHRDILCAARSLMGRHIDFARADLFISTVLSVELGLHRSLVYQAIGSSSFCSPSFGRTVQAPTQEVVQKPAPKITFYIDEQGFPFSKNLAWNACIRGTVLRDRDGKPFNCNRYHSGISWMHPDMPGLQFTFNNWRQKIITVPETHKIVVMHPAYKRRIVNNFRQQLALYQQEDAKQSDVLLAMVGL